MTPKTPHQQLIGTWKSDRRKTFQHWKPLPTATESNHRKFKAMFGHLVLRWTRARCYNSFDDFKTGDRYEVIASDDDSLVIRMAKAKWMGEGFELHHIHFDATGIHYWMPLSIVNGFVEWFRRVE